MTAWSPVDLLPALWVGAVGAALAWALRRWYDRVPLRVLAVFALALGLLFGPVLGGGRLLLPLDTLRGAVPFRGLEPTDPFGNVLQGDLIQLVTPSLERVRDAWADGRWPLWNRLAGAGMPLLADPQSQALQPLVLLGYPLPLFRAAGAVAALRVLFALVFGFLWMRRQGLEEAAALAGSLAFGLGGFLLLWVGWPIANSAALLPLVLYGIARCDDPGGRRDALLLALGTGSLLLGGHPETVAYGLGLSLAVLAGRIAGRPPGERSALARRAGAALLVAAMATAPVLLPAAVYLPRTLRAARIGPSATPAAHGRGGAIAATAATYLPLVAPNAYGNSRFAAYWGRVNSNEDDSGFVGTAALLAVLLAARARRRFPQERMALALAALCLLLIAPLPGGGSLASHRLLLPLSLCLAYLGACSLERCRRGEIPAWAVAAAALALGGVIAWGYLAHPDPTGAGRLAIFHAGWLRWQLRFLGLAALLLLASAVWRRGRSMAVVGVAAAVLAELVLLHRPASPPMPQRLAMPTNRPLFILRLRLTRHAEQGEGWRMAALGPDFPPNLASLYGFADARIYNPMAPRAYMELLAPIVAGWRGESPLLAEPGDPLYRRLGVRYLLAAPDARLPSPLRQIFADADGSVWLQPGARRRLFLDGDPPPEGVLAILRLADARLTARADFGAPGTLRSVLYQDGGWRLLLNGAVRPTVLEQRVFLAAPLPAGESRIELLYRPAGLFWGLVIAALGLALGAAMGLGPRPSPGEGAREGKGEGTGE